MKHSSPTTCHWIVALALGAASLAHAQQNPAPVMKMNQVTEEALVDALAIDPPQAAEEPGKTRGIRPTARNVPDRPASKAPGKSNLLITFNTNSSELTGESKQALATVARALQSDKLAGFSFSIEGHADPRGVSEANQKLSEARAKSVVDFLVASFGILPERLAPVGKGSSELLNPDKPDAAENRRVTIVTKRL
jgi:outer membrane protein OmpA-like peptidoglycan-associated protein